MDIEKLKQKILELAITGKLVPQDPNDEPATTLIEKIKAERDKLVKDGIIKKIKEESYIYKGSDNSYYEKIGKNTKNINDEIPFDIPKSWTWVRLGSISNYGNNCLATNDDINEHDWVLDLEDIESYSSKLIKIKEKGNIVVQSVKHKFSKGDLLFSKLRIYLKKVIIAPRDGFCSSEILPLDFKPFCLNEYALLFLISPYFLKKIETLQYGCKMPRLGTNDGKKILFPLPPFEEQKRIVNEINLIKEQIDKISASKKELSKNVEYLKSAFLSTIFSANSSYKSYYEKVFKISDVLDYIQPGPYIVSSTKYNDSFKIPVLTPGKTFILGYTDDNFGIFHADKNKKVIIFDDFTTASRIVDFDFKVKSSAMKILVVKDKEKFNVNYMYYLLQTIKINNDSHKRFWISEYSSKNIKIHTIDEQIKIVNFINKAFDLIDSIIK